MIVNSVNSMVRHAHGERLATDELVSKESSVKKSLNTRILINKLSRYFRRSPSTILKIETISIVILDVFEKDLFDPFL